MLGGRREEDEEAEKEKEEMPDADLKSNDPNTRVGEKGGKQTEKRRKAYNIIYLNGLYMAFKGPFRAFFRLNQSARY